MATRKKRSSRRASASRVRAAVKRYALNDRGDRSEPEGLEGPEAGAELTGNLLVSSVGEGTAAMNRVVAALRSASGISAARVCSTEDFETEEGITGAAMDSAGIVRFEGLNVAIVKGDPDEIHAASAAAGADAMIVEPEYWNFPLGRPSAQVEPEDALGLELDGDAPAPIVDEGAEGVVSRDFLLGARAAIDMMLRGEGGEVGAQHHFARCLQDSRSVTWGLQATRAGDYRVGGRGVRVAVLDSGFDAAHPDFAGRSVTRQSFIPRSEPDNDADDRNGHGTHCIGTACGSSRPQIGPRYGVAHEAEIFSGKVLRQGPRGAAGADGWILAGIDWALRNRCQIISMSLGSPSTSAQYPMAYERAARAGLRAGTLILAATGNDSDHPRRRVAAVGRPANCPSIASVAAVDRCFRIASFSNAQRFGNGGEVNFAGPGVDVLSSVPMPRRRAYFDGTSMATPHAAGIAALIVQQTGATGVALYREMRQRCRYLGSRTLFGNGLVRV